MKAHWTKERLEEVCKDSYSLTEALTKLGLSPVGSGNRVTFKKKTAEYGIDISHFTGQNWMSSPHRADLYESWRKTRKPSYNWDEILVEHSPITRASLKRKLLNHNKLEYRCAECGCNGNWRGKTIALELDHINGINDDNRLENLRFLCPNCHAASSTYCGKNIEKWKKQRASKFEG